MSNWDERRNELLAAIENYREAITPEEFQRLREEGSHNSQLFARAQLLPENRLALGSTPMNLRGPVTDSVLNAIGEMGGYLTLALNAIKNTPGVQVRGNTTRVFVRNNFLIAAGTKGAPSVQQNIPPGMAGPSGSVPRQGPELGETLTIEFARLWHSAQDDERWDIAVNALIRVLNVYTEGISLNKVSSRIRFSEKNRTNDTMATHIQQIDIAGIVPDVIYGRVIAARATMSTIPIEPAGVPATSDLGMFQPATIRWESGISNKPITKYRYLQMPDKLSGVYTEHPVNHNLIVLETDPDNPNHGWTLQKVGINEWLRREGHPELSDQDLGKNIAIEYKDNQVSILIGANEREMEIRKALDVNRLQPNTQIVGVCTDIPDDVITIGKVFVLKKSVDLWLRDNDHPTLNNDDNGKNIEITCRNDGSISIVIGQNEREMDQRKAVGILSERQGAHMEIRYRTDTTSVLQAVPRGNRLLGIYTPAENIRFIKIGKYSVVKSDVEDWLRDNGHSALSDADENKNMIITCDTNGEISIVIGANQQAMAQRKAEFQRSEQRRREKQPDGSSAAAPVASQSNLNLPIRFRTAINKRVGTYSAMDSLKPGYQLFGLYEPDPLRVDFIYVGNYRVNKLDIQRWLDANNHSLLGPNDQNKNITIVNNISGEISVIIGANQQEMDLRKAERQQAYQQSQTGPDLTALSRQSFIGAAYGAGFSVPARLPTTSEEPSQGGALGSLGWEPPGFGQASGSGTSAPVASQSSSNLQMRWAEIEAGGAQAEYVFLTHGHEISGNYRHMPVSTTAIRLDNIEDPNNERRIHVFRDDINALLASMDHPPLGYQDMGKKITINNQRGRISIVIGVNQQEMDQRKTLATRRGGPTQGFTR